MKNGLLGRFTNLSEPNKKTIYLLLLLIVGDFFYITIHSINVLSAHRNPLFHLGVDRGYPEFYNYIKYLWIITLLILFSRKNKTVYMFPFIILYFYFLIDDSFMFHENLGIYFRDNYNFQIPLLGRQEFGELLPSVTAFSVFMILFLILSKYSAFRFKYISVSMFILIFLLVFFGVFIDALNESNYSHVVNYFFTLAEDGGELIVISLTCWWSFLLLFCDENELKTISDIFNEFLVKIRLLKD